MTIDFLKEVEDASRRLEGKVVKTPLVRSDFYSEVSGANVFLKLENLQHTGSFKVRGAMNKILSLTDEELERGVVTASTGNHGAAVAYSLKSLGAKGTVFVSPNASRSKVDNIRRLGAEIVEYGDDPIEAENYAREFAEKESRIYVSPYNDPKTIGGQGTTGVEIYDQLSETDAVFVAVGGGGLISGIAEHLKSVRDDVRIVGCSPDNSKVMIESVELGRLVGDLPSLPTISDGTAGGIEDGSITFGPCREKVDEWVTVTEDEIRQELVRFIDIHHMLIEGAAAVAIAAFLKRKDDYAGKNVVIVLCGANVGSDSLYKILGDFEKGAA